MSTRKEQGEATVTRLDGQPMVPGEDGLIHGDEMILTDEQRARLPALDPLGDGPIEYVEGVSELPADLLRETIVISRGPNVDGPAHQALAAHGAPPAEEG